MIDHIKMMNAINIQDMGDDSLRAYDEAVTRYIRARKERVPGFVNECFSLRGALRLNKKAFGADLLKTPLNVAWCLPYIGLKASGAALKKLGLSRISKPLDRLPPGFVTRVQKELNWLIYTRLLELPYAQGERSSNHDALLTEILNQPRITSLFSMELEEIYSKSKHNGYRAALEKNLLEYSKSRTAAADLAGNIISLSAGISAFGKFTPGTLTAGNTLAAVIAHKMAVSNFILGPSLGGFYYSMFPAAASPGLIALSTGGVLLALSVAASFSGVLTDPIQSRLGLHKRRLLKLIDTLERQLRGADDSGLKIRDQYFVRVFDLLDLLKKASQTVI